MFRGVFWNYEIVFLVVNYCGIKLIFLYENGSFDLNNKYSIFFLKKVV